MNRKQLLIALVLLAVVEIGALMYFRGIRTIQTPVTEEQVLREADEYFRRNPVMACTQAETPAVHKATGIRHTFNTGCIPPGWEAEYDR